MVFCDYRSNTDKDVTYAYGASPEDITGVVTFHYKDDLIEIVNGIFKKKISFES